jgi:hypothetical protein
MVLDYRYRSIGYNRGIGQYRQYLPIGAYMSRKVYKVSLSQEDAALLEEKLKKAGAESLTAFVRKAFGIPAKECEVWKEREEN